MRSDRTGSYRDSHGRRLEDYPRPSVAVDTALLTLDAGAEGLSVLQVRRADGHGWALPGTFLHPGERLIDAVSRALHAKAGVEGVTPRQLHVFDDPDRDERGWVLSVAHLAVVPAWLLLDRLPDTRLRPVDTPGRLPWGHGAIVARALAEVRRRYRERPDPDRLLTAPFTMRELQLTHAAVLGEALQKDTFRRAMEPGLASTGETTAGTRGRPAELFRHT